MTQRVARTGGRNIRSLAGFAFREVTYGENMTSEGKRSHHLRTAQAFADLADLLELPDAAMSLNGLLALDMGGSQVEAWYLPDTRTIRTSRTMVGVVAHEWWHALDHYLGGDDYRSARCSRISKACESSGFASRKLPVSSQDARYLREPHEMMARAFEGYVLRKLLFRGWVSDFLVCGPYRETMPTEDEARVIDPAIEHTLRGIRP